MIEPDANLPAKPPAERVFVSQAGAEQVASDVGQKLAGVARTGFGTAASTVRWMGWLAVALAIAAGYVAGRKSGTAGFLAVLLALGVTVVTGFLLAIQRGGLLAAADGVAASGIASKLFQMVFDKVISATQGEGSAGFVARTAGRIPLSQAEARLREAVDTAIPTVHQAGGVFSGIFRKAQTTIVATIRRLTLAEFRRDDAAGGIDLARVRDHLSVRIDQAAASGIRKRVRWLTAGYVLVTCAVVMAMAWGLRMLFA